MTFPVVSADSDHRLLSGNPSGCAEGVNYINALGRPFFNRALTALSGRCQNRERQRPDQDGALNSEEKLLLCIHKIGRRWPLGNAGIIHESSDFCWSGRCRFRF